MKRKALLQLLAIFSLSTLNPTSSSSQMLFGVRFTALSEAVLPPDFQGDNNTSFGSFLGRDISSKETVYLGVDYSSFSLKGDPTGDVSWRQIVPWLGLRYYLEPRFKEKVSPVLTCEVFKTYTRLKDTRGGIYSDGDLEYLEKLYAPWGFAPSFCAEYVYSPAFSISGQVGLRFSYSKASISGSSNFQDQETKRKTVSGFVSIILNFRWRKS